MLMLNEEMPIYLETLNTLDQPMTEVAARLRHLSAQSAVIAFAQGLKTPGLHWGARVRFRVESDSQHYNILGMVVATNLRDTAFDTEEEEALREILVRVWECQSASQRREAPRRRTRFAIKYQNLPLAAGEHENWLTAQCVDISAGGLRLRVACPEAAPERVRLMLSLPAMESLPSCEMELTGRVLRMEQTGRARQMALIAIKFERIAPHDSLELAKRIKE